jgi:hypothetical protein
MSDITRSNIESEIQREFASDKGEVLIRKFHDLMLGNTSTKVASEAAVYHHDAAAIFGLLKIPVEFVDADGKDLAVDASGSGVYSLIGR